MSDKVRIKFNVRLHARGIEMDVDADKANTLLALAADDAYMDLEQFEEHVDLSGKWQDIVNAGDVEIEDVEPILPEIAKLDNT